MLAQVGSTSTEGPFALPLLEGLSRRPGVADSIVKDALVRWKAGRLIVRYVEQIWKERKTRLKRVSNKKKGSDTKTVPPVSKRRQMDSGKKDDKQKQMRDLQQRQLKEEGAKQGGQHNLKQGSRLKSPHRNIGDIHWLIQSLSSPSVKQRRVAFKILAMGCPMDDTSIRSLIELVIFLIKEGNAFRDADATCMVGWLTLLKFLLVRILSDQERLAYCIRPNIGLIWLCRSLWKVSLLSQQQKQLPTGTIRVCLSFVDIIHSLVLSGTSDAIHSVHNLLWSEKKHKRIGGGSDNLYLISPLACLMGTYHVWTDTHLCSGTVNEKYLTMMQQLIDPSLMPEISPSSGSSVANAHEKKGDQRLVSFLGKCNDSSKAINDKENSSAMNATKNRLSSTILSNRGLRNAKAGTNEPISSNKADEATSPGGDSMVSSNIGSSPAEKSMVTSVARLFSSLYGTNSSSDVAGEDDAINHGHSGESQDPVDAYHDDNDVDEGVDEDHLLEPLTDEEDQDDTNDDDENENEFVEDDEAAEVTSQEASKKKKEESAPDDENSKNDKNDDSSNDDDKSVEEANEIDSEDDEEIDSDEGEDCEDCGSMIDIEEEDDEEEDEIMIHEDELPQIEQGLLELQRDFNNKSSSTGNASTSYPKELSGHGSKERSQFYIKAAMEVLAIQYPPLSKSKFLQGYKQLSPLTVSAEKALMASIMRIVKPEKKPLDGKIILRRAPTQEEFLRNQSKDVISFSTLKCPTSGNTQEEPTVRDLRQYVANDLQMGDSAEMLEVLVANKILDVDLKLRVILQTVWKEHLVQHSGGSSSTSSLSSLLIGGGRGGTRSFLSSSSGLSLMLYSSLERSMGSARTGSLSVTAETPFEALPPMVMTYRLAGVDGEATEDTISTLKDPEAPLESESEEEMQLLMEKEYGITRTVMTRRGVFCLLRSAQSNIMHTLKKIRRDDVGGSENYARTLFNQSFYPGLSLLICCAKLPTNRKLLLQARAPTTLLRLLLDVLDALEEDESTQSSESNSTATGLQELIEILASDILSSNGDASSEVAEENEGDEDASTLRLLIQAIKTSCLSRTLRNVIAKLVPYLTYGKSKLSKELASEFMIHVDSDELGEYESVDDSEKRNSIPKSVLMDTFIHTSTCLPANEVCNSLRTELLKCGFIERIMRHILRDCPIEPPSWSPSLWSKGEKTDKQKQTILEEEWKEYSKRPGLKTSFEILIGLCKEHPSTQAFLGKLDIGEVSFLQFCHWLECTSDNTSAAITMKSFGLLAETLLDDIADFGISSSEEVKKIKSLRKKTRDRKKEIAMERRKKSLISMNKFSSFTGGNSKRTYEGDHDTNRDTNSGAAPFWAPALDLFRDSSNTQDASPSIDAAQPSASKKIKKSPVEDSEKSCTPLASTKPDWMKELENMEDETGLKCAVCQEGRKYKSSEMMGLYAYVKKVSIPNGDRSNLDGTSMLTNLPSSLPASLEDSLSITEWFQSGKATGDLLKQSATSSSSSKNRSNHYTTTVTAGNAIHISCHAKARLADRNHPKAPKSEWEGAALRNSRVNCNIIFPLVSARSSSVSLILVEQALTEHQTAVANMIGVNLKSNLWMVLHDVRLMLLRLAYGEALNADCGGGSLGSNSQLIYHQLSMAKMFETEAAVDSPDTAEHARNLSAGFLAACEIVSAKDFDSLGKSTLLRGIADSSLMAALTCILFHNTKEDFGSSSDDTENCPHPKRRWTIGKELFLRGMLNCAGCRHALAIHSSGCVSTRNIGKKRNRSRSFAEWDTANDNMGDQNSSPFTTKPISRPSGRKSTSPKINSSRAIIDDFGSALRPMITYYALMDQLSSDFAPNYEDEKIEECADCLVRVIEACQKSKSIHELLDIAKITLPHEQIIHELQRGMMSA